MNSNITKLLLDTSFILPSMGIKITNTLVHRCLTRIAEQRSKYQLYYTQMNLLEATWVYLREKKSQTIENSSKEIFMTGLRSVIDQYKEVMIISEDYSFALELYTSGHSDMLDCLEFAAAARIGLSWLTLDRKMYLFLTKVKISTKFLLLGEDFLLQ